MAHIPGNVTKSISKNYGHLQINISELYVEFLNPKKLIKRCEGADKGRKKKEEAIKKWK